jgi:hypothetical protein
MTPYDFDFLHYDALQFLPYQDHHFVFIVSR